MVVFLYFGGWDEQKWQKCILGVGYIWLIFSLTFLKLLIWFKIGTISFKYPEATAYTFFVQTKMTKEQIYISYGDIAVELFYHNNVKSRQKYGDNMASQLLVIPTPSVHWQLFIIWEQSQMEFVCVCVCVCV